MERKRLRVDGIPTDIPAGRAKDKLTIHFLRSRNGGGEVENIDIIQGNPAYAIVTFEDDEVVDSVLRVKAHTLEIHDKIYHLVVSEVTDKLEVEEVFQKLSLTISYKKFPASCRGLLKNLRQTHKDVKFDYDDKFMTCTISGPYAKIQTLAQEILSELEVGEGNVKHMSSDTRRKTKSDRIKNHSDPRDPPLVLAEKSVPHYGSAVEAKYSQQTESLEQLQEPFVWDSDIFKYIQKFHTLEYQEILSKYHVQAVDESGDGITTIYLQAVNGGKNHLTDLSYARSRLMGLYQGLELILRKEQIDKRDIHGDSNFHRVLLRDLQKSYPMLLCHDDDRYLYLIGNGVDVAQGKQYLSDLQMKFDRPSAFSDPQFSGASSISEGAPLSLSPTYKHESKVGSRIAASFSVPTTQNTYLKTHMDEKYLVSSNSHSRQLLDRASDPPIDRMSLESPITGELHKKEDMGHSLADEKSESKTMPSLKRRDVFPSLKTGREDIRQSRSTSKATGPLKPVRITKASSELAYSSLVDVNLPPMDFKVPEGKLRRSNSLSRVHSKESASTEQQSDTLIFNDEVIVTDWLWHYIKQNHKSDIDSWCSEVVLKEETKKGKVTLKLKATNRSALTVPKEKIQLLCWKEDVNVANSSLDYATIGVQGPDDSALDEWCDLFRKCSKKLSIKLEEDKMVLVYPKEIQALIQEEYSQHTERKVKPPSDEAMTENGQSSLCLKDNLEFSDNNMDEEYITELMKKQSLEEIDHSKPHLEHLSFHSRDEDMAQVEKGPSHQKYSMFAETDPFQGITQGSEAFFDSPMAASPDENSLRTKRLQDFFEDQKFSLKSEKLQTETANTEVKTYDRGSYTNELLSQEINYSPTNIPNQNEMLPRYGELNISTEGHVPEYQSSSTQLRIPAVGQESEIVDPICVQCKKSVKTAQILSGQNMCIDCYISSITSARKEATKHKNTLGATMTHTSMSLTLPGYERDTSLKIIYDVPDGVQGDGDPQPGCLYKGGKFEAYLPDNREGKRLLKLLQRALDEDLIFHIKKLETGEKVTWYKIPHKTSPDGGKQKNGYPDSSYMKYVIDLLKQNGIE
ncbi:uncharacterized protein [Engystomops pustulosus]|uniref:uncharacterized protein n=1 Tax=Engystomops pustulosus TaxID=76066 RepID=UPI003AFA789D